MSLHPSYILLDAWFFEAAGVGRHLPSPGWLAASQRLNRWLKRGGLSFGAQGGPSLRLGATGRLCAGGSRDGNRAAKAREWAQTVGLQGKWHGRTCMPSLR